MQTKYILLPIYILVSMTYSARAKTQESSPCTGKIRQDTGDHQLRHKNTTKNNFLKV